MVPQTHKCGPLRCPGGGGTDPPKSLNQRVTKRGLPSLHSLQSSSSCVKSTIFSLRFYFNKIEYFENITHAPSEKIAQGRGGVENRVYPHGQPQAAAARSPLTLEKGRLSSKNNH